MELYENRLLDYIRFCKKRHAIYLRRQKGMTFPWTDDAILSTYKFTNIYRELDTGTIWLRENMREPYANDPYLAFNIALYRRYNYWPFAEEIFNRFGWITAYPLVAYALRRFAEYHQAAGGKVFTGAHMINCPVGYANKADYVFGGSVDLWNNRGVMENNTTLKEAFDKLVKISGIGPFIGYEIVTDLRWTRYLENATDILTWANPGPGAQRGILRLMNYPVVNRAGLPTLPNDVIYPMSFINAMQVIMDFANNVLPDWMPKFEMRDVEHSLCEFDKYERVRLGEGKPRSRYKPNGL